MLKRAAKEGMAIDPQPPKVLEIRDGDEVWSIGS